VRFEDAKADSHLDVPAAHRPVCRSRDQYLAVSIYAEARDWTRVAGEHLQGATVLERPRTRRAVGRPGDEDVLDLEDGVLDIDGGCP